MTEPKLIDPSKLYHTEEFPKQDQDTPALQKEMQPVPDCGEESYEGSNQLENRRVLITGGDSGIGRAAAIAFAREVADIGLYFFPGEEEDAKQVASYIEKAGRKVVLLPYDLRDETAPKEIVEKVVSELGGLDTLVLNAGQQISCPAFEEIPLEQVKDTFMVNILAMFAIVKEAVPQLDEGQPEDSIPEFGQQSLLERAGQPVELAPVYVFLASNKASYVTAQIYGVTGGEAINL